MEILKVVSRKTKNKTISLAIIALFVLSIGVSTTLPHAGAQTTSTAVAYPLLDAVPNPCGVNQPLLINYGAINYLNTEKDGWNVTIAIMAQTKH